MSGKPAPHSTGEEKLTADIRVYADPELKRLAGIRADEEGVPLSELVVKALAAYLGRPDLARVPRKSLGRPRNPMPAPEPQSA